ncbi:hypothetical protein PV325_003569 [Microctonus aethiopoides]|uniref:Uncharacterized protein n=1 Tax=Microctonus aethiopoides TaxID=144406 RepID=A0AA39F956_9HYME|nr:hypothetical protein PV325_003569 [Microctonus aethiopoides]KAK0165262.1 hypothetical protein PV328_003794 [Microctonus aethiopoides]
MTKEMSKNCKYFVQHAWKQDLCANCFELREDHRRKLKQLNTIIPDFAASLKSILRRRENNQKQRKNVVFRMSLTEIIGYGGDDLYDCSENNSNDIDDNVSKDINDDDDDDEDVDDNDKNRKLIEDTIISKQILANSDEEERVLSNLTRNNTNFNRITANLNDLPGPSTSSVDAEKITNKSFNNLMLGNIQKDSEGQRKTLLVSVTPFGSNNSSSVISAGRSADKATIDDERKRVIPRKIVEISNIESNCSMSTNSNQQLSQLDKTPGKKCHETNERGISSAIKFNYDEESNEKSNINQLINEDVNMENTQEDNSKVKNIPLNSGQNTINKETEDMMELLNDKDNCEHDLLKIEKSNESKVMEINNEKLFEDASSNLSSIDCSTIDSLSDTSVVSPTPRNSFLHSGKTLNDVENSSAKSDEINVAINSSSCVNTTKYNLSTNFKNNEEIIPKPPEKLSDDLTSSIFTRKPASILKSDCPVVREKEKRERATSCSPKFRKMDENLLNRNYNNEIPETMSKRCATRSLTRHSSSSYSQVLSNANSVDDEIKKKNKTRFSLKRLLRIGSSKKDLNITSTDSFVEITNDNSSISQFKNRPEIIHPLELNGAAVEILYHEKLINITDEITSTKSPSVKVSMREPPPPPPNNVYSSTKSECHPPSTNKSTSLSLHDEHGSTKLSAHDVDREHPSCHSISTTTTTSSVHSITGDSIHTGIHNFGKFRPIQCN